jgi:hypothetical protein
MKKIRGELMQEYENVNDEEDTEIIKYKNYLGDYRLRHRVVFERDTYMSCVYCGNPSDTREHCPSKVFLEKPLPTDLPVVPSCKECNNSFSGDELYVSVLIELLKNYCYKEEYPLKASTMKRIKERKDAQEAVASFEKIRITNIIENDSRIIRILQKLAVCHATYELSEGYQCDKWTGQASSLQYGFRPYLSQNEIDNMDSAIVINNMMFPEIGSRVYEHIYVVQPLLQSIDGDKQMMLNLCMMDWTDIQDDNYRYICWLDNDNIYVRIVIKEFLYAQIQFVSK